MTAAKTVSRARDAVDGPPDGAILCRFGELAEVRAVELVRLAELVQEPDDLVGMAYRVGGELGGDDEVDRQPVRLGQVDEPPQERLRQHARARIPLVRHGDELRLVVALAQLGDEVVDEDLRSAADERDLSRADRDPHRRATIA